MSKLIKPHTSLIVTFPEDLLGYSVCLFKIESKFNWKFWKGRQKFYFELLESQDNFPSEIDDEAVSTIYCNTIQYKKERCLYIHNVNDTPLEVNISISCYTAEQYTHLLYDVKHYSSPSGI